MDLLSHLVRIKSGCSLLMAGGIIVQRLVKSQVHIGGQSNIMNPSYGYCDFTAKRHRTGPCAGA
jgi:hypothetical protein